MAWKDEQKKKQYYKDYYQQFKLNKGSRPYTEEMKQYQIQYREDNKEKLQQYYKEYYQKYKKKKLEKKL